MAAQSPVNNSAQTVCLQVRRSPDVERATEATRQFARQIGFSQLESEELALATAELASNLVRHAGGGAIKLSSLTGDERPGIQMESEDQGPGIADVERAITDGYSTAGGLGNGLGTVNRLVDELQFAHQPGGGLRILCQRWVRPSPGRVSSHRLECGSATRPCRLAPENGDALVLKQWDNQALLGVIDGLGHGPLARKAAQAARQYVEAHFDQPLPNLFRGVGRVCRSTRGVVMALGKFDLSRQTVSLASIGNVEVRLVGGSAPVHLVARRGILGLHSPEPAITHHAWTPAQVVIMHSDGLDDRWKWDDFPELAHKPAALIARRLLLKLGTTQDDATVLVARNAQPC